MKRMMFIVASGAAALAVSVTAAYAAITTFAQFSATSSDRNVRWVNNAVASNSAVENSDSGSGG